jgi:hypothetical protein
MVVEEGGGRRWVNLVMYKETTPVSSMIGRYWVIKWVGLVRKAEATNTPR